MKPDSSYRSEEALGKRSANRITVAYSGVHPASQIALAAAEASLLDEFLCSLFVTPGKWGGWLARWVGDQTLVNRRCAGLPGDRVREHPWPFLSHRLKLKAFGAHHEPWTAANPKFDRWVAARLASSHSQVFVGYETCARDSFRVAQEKGMLRLLDVPQVHSAFLIQTLRSAHEELGLPFTGRIDNDEIAARKDEELRLADRILIYSEVHRRSFLE
ncbi:MAG: glycosyltransferase family 4 protein, partial [Chthoniobacterales bacterium]